MNRLYRSRRNRIIGGVCGGLAEALNWDPSLVRLLWVLVTLAGGSGVIFYIAAWLIIPPEPPYEVL